MYLESKPSDSSRNFKKSLMSVKLEAVFVREVNVKSMSLAGQTLQQD